MAPVYTYFIQINMKLIRNKLAVLIKRQCFDWTMIYTRQTYYVTINLFVSC